jgi:hypothetical protein
MTKRLILFALLTINCSGSQLSSQQRLELCVSAATLSPTLRKHAAELEVAPEELAETICRAGKMVKDAILENSNVAGAAAK